jgi:hypothetical protein
MQLRARLKGAVQPQGDSMATIITVTPDDVGTIVASNGVLTSIGVPTMPDPNWPPGAFTLVDAGGPSLRQLINIEANNIGIIVGEVVCRQRSGLGYGPVMSTYSIPFNELMVAAVPRGAVIELTVQ